MSNQPAAGGHVAEPLAAYLGTRLLLDTNVISELLRPQPEPRVQAFLNTPALPFVLCTVVLAELWAGLARLPDGQRKQGLRQRSEQVLSEWTTLEAPLAFDLMAARRYADLLAHRELLGHPISHEDAQIAAIAYAHQCTLVTRNVRDFEGCNIVLLNPWL